MPGRTIATGRWNWMASSVEIDEPYVEEWDCFWGFFRWKKRSNFLGKDSLMKQLGEFRLQKLTMLEIDTDDQSDPEGNHSVWMCGKV